MQQTMLNHPKLWWSVRTGSEGPQHDPYHYEEHTFKTPKGVTVYHFGLGDWALHNGTPLELPPGPDGERLAYLRNNFTRELTGYTFKALERISRKCHERCAECGGKHFTSMRGYPGEHFSVCTRCGGVGGYRFNVAEVI